MQRSTKRKAQLLPASLMLATATLLASHLCQAQTAPSGTPHTTPPVKPRAHRPAKKAPAPQPVAQAPAPPPLPQWPINDNPKPASVVWDSGGLRINASNSSLQQILTEVSTETGSKVVGSVPDQRVFGSYGPGDARDVLSELLLGSGYNVLLSGDLGHGAPSQIVLSPRRSGAGNGQNNNANRPQQDPDEDIPDQPEQPEEEPQPQVQQPMPPETRPGFGPNGPMRTPQQVMEEMQQRQLLQQQQMQQQQQQQNNQTAPQQNPQ